MTAPTVCADCGIPLADHLADGACPCVVLWCVRRRAHLGKHLPHPGHEPLPLPGDEPAALFGGAA